MAKFKYEKFGNTTYFPSGSTVGNAQGDVTYIGGGAVTAGYIYYLSPIATLGTYEWTLADADFTITSGGLLAVALGTGTASTVGMLLRGMVTLAIAPQGGNTPGMNLYLSASAGRATTDTPTNDFPRTIGFTTTAAVGGGNSKLIWFNTDNGFLGGLGAATGISFNNITALASTVSPVNGTAAVGTSTTVARQDHVHGTDTTRAPLASPTFTGTVVLPSGQALIAPALGTVASGNIAACTGLPIINGTTGTLSAARGGTGVITSTGSGSNVLSNTPTLTGPHIGSGAIFDGATSGTIKLQATAVAGNNILTLPAETGTLATVGGTETLSGKTLSSPTFTGTVTGISKGMVGLGNVDNTSNATERAAAATLTNKTLTTPIISSISNTGTLTLPTSTDTLVGRDTIDILTNKTLTSPTLTTPILGTPQSGDLTSCTGTFQQITGITVDYNAWYLNSGLYEYDISNASITSNTVVDVIPDNADYTIVLAAQLLPANVSSAGEVKIFAVNEPTDDINVTLNLFK